MSPKIVGIGIAALILSAVFFFVSFAYNFRFFYHSKPSDLAGFSFTVLFLMFYAIAICFLKQIKMISLVLLILSCFSVILVVIMWATHFNGTNPVIAVLTFLVVLIMTPFYGISFWFGAGNLPSWLFLSVLSGIVLFLLLLKFGAFFKNRRCRYEKT